LSGDSSRKTPSAMRPTILSVMMPAIKIMFPSLRF
jgi:hypothetical protein